MTQSTPPLAERLAAVRQAVADASSDAGRDVAEITTVVVTKFQPASLVRELYELGVRHVGESRHQEARVKSAELAELDLEWHFVGQLQSKKARQVAAYCRVIHSLDRESLIRSLSIGDPSSRERPPRDTGADSADSTGVFLQLDLDRAPDADPGRGGAAPNEMERMAELIVAAPGLRLLGVMAVAPLGEEPRSSFARLRELSSVVQRVAPGATAISAGMSGDFREAILEGATHLRIGTAITGNRPAAG